MLAIICLLPDVPPAAADRVAVLSRLLHRAVAVCCTPPPATPPCRPQRSGRGDSRSRVRGHLRRAGRRAPRSAMTWTVPAGLRGPPATPRRRRHVVPVRRRPPLVPMDEHRQDVPLAEIPPHLRNAFVAVEDHRFYSHPGVDPIALGRAVVRNLRSSGTVEGRQHADAAARADAVPVEPEDLRPQGPRGGARADDRRAAVEGPGPRAVSQPHLPERRRLRRRDDVAAPVRKAGEAADAGRERADRRPGARAVGAVAVVEPRRRASRAATSCWRGCARKGFITAGAGTRPRSRRGSRIRPYPGRDRSARRLREGVSAAAVPRSVRRRPSARLGGADDVRAGAAGGGRARGRRRAAALRPAASCRRRWWRSIRRPATSSRSSAGATSGSRSSTARRAAAGSPAPRSSRSCTPPRSRTATRRCRVLEGLATIAPQGPEEWAPRNASGETPDALTLRAALLESNNRAATALQQRHRLASGPAAGVGRRPARPARRAVAVARHRARHAARSDGRVRRVSRTAATPSGRAAIVRVVDADGEHRDARTPCSASASSRRAVAFQMVSMLGDVIDRGTGARRAQLGRAVPGRRQDRHHRRLQGRLVRRLLVVGRRRRVGRLRSAADDRHATPTARATRCRSGATSCAAPRAAGRRRRSRSPAGLQRGAAVQHLVPAAGGRLPDLHGVFKEGDEVPGRLCPFHQGSIKQRVRRSVEGLLLRARQEAEGDLPLIQVNSQLMPPNS